MTTPIEKTPNPINPVVSSDSNNVSSGSKGTENASPSYDDIAWFQNAISSDAPDEDNAPDEDKVQSGMKFGMYGMKFGIDFLLSLLGSNEESAITKETTRIETQSSNLEIARQSAADKTQQAVEKITSDIQANIDELNTLLESIEETNEEKEEYEKQLEECNQTLEENKQILNDPNSTKEEKEAALQAISGVSATISDLSTKINDLVASIEESDDAVSGLEDANEDLNGQSDETINAGIQEQQGYQQQQQGLDQENKATQTRAVTDEGIGETATTMSETVGAGSSAASAIPIIGGLFGSSGQVVSQKLQQVGSDYSGAGLSGLNSVGIVDPMLKTVSGLISGDLTAFSQLPTAIGSIIDNGNSVSYEYYDISNSIGSDLANASGLEDEAAGLEEAIDEAENKLESENDGENQDGQESPVFNFETPILEELSA